MSKRNFYHEQKKSLPWAKEISTISVLSVGNSVFFSWRHYNSFSIISLQFQMTICYHCKDLPENEVNKGQSRISQTPGSNLPEVLLYSQASMKVLHFCLWLTIVWVAFCVLWLQWSWPMWNLEKFREKKKRKVQRNQLSSQRSLCQWMKHLFECRAEMFHPSFPVP